MIGFVAGFVAIGAAVGCLSHYLRRFPNARIGFVAFSALLCAVLATLSVITRTPLHFVVVNGALAVGMAIRGGYRRVMNRPIRSS